ncbi:ROK family transcriptional regulator [Microbispora hainanensis]|uniref:ROK family transcriptional regulator n=1 Tax=Microbispora hainanensis TaxID=568844 RepID=A0ABZ1SZU9_9ACTN|nr:MULTISPECIES: ROK family transcriptional regulator [Microbispora]NJP23639.1 ROK family transcriptional regulator [Microbispora sp. CL1-1]TQS15856.1 ROK family transcriptional regulator [Microbispora sp. SCL1-1]
MITSHNGPQPADFTDVRATNLAVVLRFVRENAPCSRADIAASTGLNKATVSSLVADLIDRRLLRETGLTEHRVGRPATMLVLDGSPYAAIGIEVNVDYISAVAVDLKGEELLNWRRSFPGGTSSAGQAVVAMAALARRVVSRMTKEARQVLGLTVAVPGLVDVNGNVRVAPNLGWRDADLAGDLTKALRDPGFPVLVDNDANLAALAEHRFGPHRNAANLVYVTGEVGVGAGIIMDGRLRRGGQGYSGEIGHIELDPAGPTCRCGRRGCLEAVAGIGAILAHTAPDASPSELELEIDEVVRRARNGEQDILALLENVGRHLGRGMAAVANMLNPEVVILGGYYVPLAPWLVACAEEEMYGRVLAPGGGGCRLEVSTLGYGAAALGAAARVLDSVDSGRLPAQR